MVCEIVQTNLMRILIAIKNNMNNKWFSLIELIVAITMLAMMGTVAIMAVKGIEQWHNNRITYNYAIYTDVWYFYTENYREIWNGCISFYDKNDKKMTACWTYTIKELDND